MKTIGIVLAALILGVALMFGYRGWTLSTTPATSAPSAGDNLKIAQLGERMQNAERSYQELKAEVEQLRATLDSRAAQAAQPEVRTTPSGAVQVQSQSRPETSPPLAALPGVAGAAQNAADLVIDPNLVSGFDSNSFFASTGPASPKEIGEAAIFAVQTAQQYSGYLTNHPFMNQQMATIETLGEQLAKDDGTDPARTAQTRARLTSTLAAAGANFGNLARGMRNDVPEVLQQSQDLQNLVGIIHNRSLNTPAAGAP